MSWVLQIACIHQIHTALTMHVYTHMQMTVGEPERMLNIYLFCQQTSIREASLHKDHLQALFLILLDCVLATTDWTWADNS